MSPRHRHQRSLQALVLRPAADFPIPDEDVVVHIVTYVIVQVVAHCDIIRWCVSFHLGHLCSMASSRSILRGGMSIYVQKLRKIWKLFTPQDFHLHFEIRFNFTLAALNRGFYSPGHGQLCRLIESGGWNYICCRSSGWFALCH